jgi:hypothetical protein
MPALLSSSCGHSCRVFNVHDSLQTHSRSRLKGSRHHIRFGPGSSAQQYHLGIWQAQSRPLQSLRTLHNTQPVKSNMCTFEPHTTRQHAPTARVLPPPQVSIFTRCDVHRVCHPTRSSQPQSMQHTLTCVKHSICKRVCVNPVATLTVRSSHSTNAQPLDMFQWDVLAPCSPRCLEISPPSIVPDVLTALCCWQQETDNAEHTL